MIDSFIFLVLGCTSVYFTLGTECSFSQSCLWVSLLTHVYMHMSSYGYCEAWIQGGERCVNNDQWSPTEQSLV